MARIIRPRSSAVAVRSRGRLMEWFFGIPFAVNSLAGTTFTFSSLNAAALAKRPFTVTRVVGSIFVGNDQVAAAERPTGAFGMMVVTDKAVATGATAIPDPVTEQSSDGWLVYRALGAIGGPDVGNPWIEFAFDSRGQRKVQEGFDLVMVFANAATSSHTMLFSPMFRILVKLS